MIATGRCTLLEIGEYRFFRIGVANIESVNIKISFNTDLGKPQILEVQALRNSVDEVKRLKIGDEIVISISLKGKEKNGKVKNLLQAYQISKA